MKKLKEIIRHFHNNKYKNSLYDFELNKKIYNKEKDIFYEKLQRSKFDNKLTEDPIYFLLKKYFINKDLTCLFIYYKKFNIFLSLKSDYKKHRAATKKKKQILKLYYTFVIL